MEERVNAGWISWHSDCVMACLGSCIMEMHQPFAKLQILDSSKLKEFADDNFNFDKNGRRFSETVENTVGKGKIAHYEQYLFFPKCFQRTFTADT